MRKAFDFGPEARMGVWVSNRAGSTRASRASCRVDPAGPFLFPIEPPAPAPEKVEEEAERWDGLA